MIVGLTWQDWRTGADSIRAGFIEGYDGLSDFQLARHSGGQRQKVSDSQQHLA